MVRLLFDKEEKTTQYDLEKLLIKYGLANILYYRTSRGYESSQLIPTLFLSTLQEKFKGKIPIQEEDVISFLTIYS